jgi:hypothetical protein
VLDFQSFCDLPPNEAQQASARRIKHLARLGAAFAQSYPQISWASGKVLFNHALAGIP